MKKEIITIGLILTALIFLAGCGNNVKGDAKKLAKLQCRVNNLTIKASEGDLSASSEGVKLGMELLKLAEELKEKYPSKEEEERLGEAIVIEMLNCE